MATKQIEIVSQSNVWAVAFADENQVVGGYCNGDIRRWEIENEQQWGPTMRAGGTILSVAVSRDGRRILSGGRGKAIIWDAVTHEKVLELTECDRSVFGVDISSDSTEFASADTQAARIYSTTSGIRLLPPLAHDSVNGIKFSPDGSRFATASRDYGFRIYSTHNGKILFDSGFYGSIKTLLPVPNPLAWSSDGQQLFVAAIGKITCFDVSNSLPSEWSIHEPLSPVSGIASNGRFIACSAGLSVSLWDCVSHKQVGSIISHTTDISSVALSPSGGYLACGVGGNIAIHNLRVVLPQKYFDHDSHPLHSALTRWLPHAPERPIKRHDTITQHSTSISHPPPNPADQLIKRSRTRAEKRLWEDALQDANEAVNADPACPWGHEAKYVALHGAKRYDDAIDAFKSMLHTIEQSNDPAINRQRKNYISPSDTVKAIDSIVSGVLKNCPLIVINVTTGYLCNGSERIRIFKADPLFKELVSSMTTNLDNERIRQVVANFFGYVMFSHVWHGNEPSFQDVSRVKSVWKLPDTPLSEKLRNFCKEAYTLGHKWAWSDTCCIDKDKSSILDQSLASMYKWYAESAATVVFLADVAHPAKFGDLLRSVWMTRAWTLQELLAPKVILFYDSRWRRYLGDIGANHKRSRRIMQELADAIKIPLETIVSFSPDDLRVHEKLRLASTRIASVGEDVVYSLIGIFKSDIRPYYGEGQADALGHLLEEIVNRSGEVTVLAWSGKSSSGKSSSYNSCLPASISAYSQTTYGPPSLEGKEMQMCITELRSRMAQQEALSIYKQVKSLPLARFASRRLQLPCIVFPVRGLSKRRGSENLYRAEVSGLGNVEFATTDNLLKGKRQKIVFAHPWIHRILGRSSGVACHWAGDLDFDADSESDDNTSLDEVLSSYTVSALGVDHYIPALRMVARLGQPFSALLLVQQPNGGFKRVSTKNEIVVSGLGANVTSKTIRPKVLEIL